jgi:CheY-like chemotaxis protein
MSTVPEISVLHVDDIETFRRMTRELVAKLTDNLKVQSAESAHAGLQTLETEDVDVIVSDFEMPGLSGIEFLQRVRDEFDDIPFILFTAEGSDNDCCSLLPVSAANGGGAHR